MLDISVIICTYNRAGFLTNSIKSLCNQSLASDQYEIIIVDNGSTDETKLLVDEFNQINSFVRYIYEPISGLSQARNTGLKNARGKFVAFIDDDAIAPPQWLSELLKTFEAVKPCPVCIGGKINPIWETEIPPWFPKELKMTLTILDLGDEPRFMLDNEAAFGTNMAFSKAILEEIGSFNTKFSLYGDEAYVQKLIIQKGLPRYYQPTAYVDHFVSKERLTKSYILNRKYLGAQAKCILALSQKENIYQRVTAVVAVIIINPWKVIYHLIKYLLIKNRNISPKATLHMVQVYSNIGYWLQTWRLIFNFNFLGSSDY